MLLRNVNKNDGLLKAEFIIVNILSYLIGKLCCLYHVVYGYAGVFRYAGVFIKLFVELVYKKIFLLGFLYLSQG